MDKFIVSYHCKEDKRQSTIRKGASEMKNNKTNMRGGFELLHANPLSVTTMRSYWKGSPWRALRECLRGA